MTMKKSKNLKGYVFSLLARRSYHSAELHKKLQQKGIGTPEEQEEIIQLCKDRGYINDEEYLKYYVQNQLERKPQSLRLLQQKLHRKGISADLTSLLNESVDEFALAQQAAQKKATTLSHRLTKSEKQQKLYRFLVSRGFSSHIAFRVVKENLKLNDL